MSGIIKVRYNKICLYCNSKFESKHFNTQFCCRNCNRKYRIKQNPEKEALRHRMYDLKMKYKMTLNDYEQMLEIQDHRCANPKCRKQFNTTIGSRPVMDHDHSCCPGENTCGKCIRGILCDHCNHMIGHAQDNVDKLQGAIQYLEIYKNLLTIKEKHATLGS